MTRSLGAFCHVELVAASKGERAAETRPDLQKAAGAVLGAAAWIEEVIVIVIVIVSVDAACGGRDGGRALRVAISGIACGGDPALSGYRTWTDPFGFCDSPVNQKAAQARLR